MSTTRPLHSHQAQVAGLVRAIAAGEIDGVRDVLAAVKPGEGKSLLPVIASATLIAVGTVERVVWVVQRDSLRLEAEEAFADPGWRAALGHALSVRPADNEPDPSLGFAGTSPPTRASRPRPICTLRKSSAVADAQTHPPATARVDHTKPYYCLSFRNNKND